VFLCEVMQMLAIHSCLTRCGTDIAVLALQKPRHVATLELRRERRSRLTVTKRWVELRGSWVQFRSICPTAESRNYFQRFGASRTTFEISKCV
jgi:hypothetical protein